MRSISSVALFASFALGLMAGLPGTVALGAESEAAVESRQASRLQEVTLRPSRLPTVARNLWGESVPSSEGQQLRGCQQTSTYLANAFDDNQWTAQAGFA